MTSRSLQERVQARLKAIERRHHLGNASGANVPPPVEPVNGVVGHDKVRDETANEDNIRGSPRSNNWRGKDFVPDHRSGSGFQRPDFHNRTGYYGRGRAPRGRGWRPQWDDFRGRRNNWHIGYR